MDKIETIITGHRSGSYAEPIPSGSKERFMAKVNAHTRIRRIKAIILKSAGMAAACAAVFISLSHPNISRELQRHHTRLVEKEIVLIEIAERGFPDEKDIIIGTAKAITGDAIALEELLPEEISDKEKSRILREYYETKLSALDRLMARYSE